VWCVLYICITHTGRGEVPGCEESWPAIPTGCGARFRVEGEGGSGGGRVGGREGGREGGSKSERKQKRRGRDPETEGGREGGEGERDLCVHVTRMHTCVCAQVNACGPGQAQLKR